MSLCCSFTLGVLGWYIYKFLGGPVAFTGVYGLEYIFWRLYHIHFSFMCIFSSRVHRWNFALGVICVHQLCLLYIFEHVNALNHNILRLLLLVLFCRHRYCMYIFDVAEDTSN